MSNVMNSLCFYKDSDVQDKKEAYCTCCQHLHFHELIAVCIDSLLIIQLKNYET